MHLVGVTGQHASKFLAHKKAAHVKTMGLKTVCMTKWIQS